MVDTAPNNHSRRHQVLTRASHSEAPARLRLSCSNPLAKPLTRPQLTAGPRTHFRFHSHSAAWPAKCVPTAMGGAPGPGELETGEWRPLAGVASCPCSDAILPKNTSAFQLRLVYQQRIRIRQGGEDPKTAPAQSSQTRLGVTPSGAQPKPKTTRRRGAHLPRLPCSSFLYPPPALPLPPQPQARWLRA